MYTSYTISIYIVLIYNIYTSIHTYIFLYTPIPIPLYIGSRFILKDDLEPLAENKYKKLTEYISLYPEYNCIFIGKCLYTL